MAKKDSIFRVINKDNKQKNKSMLIRFPNIIKSTSTNYSHFLPLLSPPYAAATTTVFPDFPATILRKMHRGGNPFSPLAQSSRSGGRGRGHSETGGRGHSETGGRGHSETGGRGQSETGGRGQSGMGGRGQGSRGGRRGGFSGGTSNRIDALGRILVRILRHMAVELNLNMRSDGYVRVADLLRLDIKSSANIPLGSHSIDEIREAVRIDNKQRFGLLEENGQLFIRANQGHSVQAVETEILLRPITSADDIPVCVHGTYRKFLDSILQSGLNRMNRLHVHFSSGLPSDNEVISGMRRGISLVIFLDVRKALEDGMKLYISENNVILTEGFDGVVPSKYFQKVLLWPSRKPVPFDICNGLQNLKLSPSSTSSSFFKE